MTTFLAKPEECKTRFIRIKKQGDHPLVPSVMGLKSLSAGRYHKWIDYNEFQTRTESLPPETSLVRSDPAVRERLWCGTRKRYTRQVAQPLSLKIERDHKGWKSYFIHDNGGRPFVVYVHPSRKRVSVYSVPRNVIIPERERSEKDDQNKWMYTNLVYENNALQKIWIGRSPRESFDGNSILLHIDGLKYVFVGETIFSFTTVSPVVSFVSPVGNNDVPYPYAIDKQGNAYLMIERVVLRPETFALSNPYHVYYQKRPHKIKSFSNYRLIVDRQ